VLFERFSLEKRGSSMHDHHAMSLKKLTGNGYQQDKTPTISSAEA
jgi:hypothetical protein